MNGKLTIVENVLGEQHPYPYYGFFNTPPKIGEPFFFNLGYDIYKTEPVEEFRKAYLGLIVFKTKKALFELQVLG